jgi:hypothetical protein
MKKTLIKISTIQSLFLFLALSMNAQTAKELPNTEKDSLYIEQIENTLEPDKVLHAEPLYIDLIRDLGARKGEKEWNVGLGLTDRNDYDEYFALVEYEWAPINRLGLEVELPFTIYPSSSNELAPESKLNGIQLAAQYTFFVSEKMKTSLALGYLHLFEMTTFQNYGDSNLFTGNKFNPFFVAAKRWGNNFHALVYTGPSIVRYFEDNSTQTTWETNTSVHYMITGTRNFIGIEFNKQVFEGNFDMTMRPQMRVGIAENLLIGIVTGIPISRENERLSTFLRLIYEPEH